MANVAVTLFNTLFSPGVFKEIYHYWKDFFPRSKWRHLGKSTTEVLDHSFMCSIRPRNLSCPVRAKHPRRPWDTGTVSVGGPQAPWTETSQTWACSAPEGDKPGGPKNQGRPLVRHGFRWLPVAASLSTASSVVQSCCAAGRVNGFKNQQATKH